MNRPGRYGHSSLGSKGRSWAASGPTTSWREKHPHQDHRPTGEPLPSRAKGTECHLLPHTHRHIETDTYTYKYTRHPTYVYTLHTCTHLTHRDSHTYTYTYRHPQICTYIHTYIHTTSTYSPQMSTPSMHPHMQTYTSHICTLIHTPDTAYPLIPTYPTHTMCRYALYTYLHRYMHIYVYTCICMPPAHIMSHEHKYITNMLTCHTCQHVCRKSDILLTGTHSQENMPYHRQHHMQAHIHICL